MNNTPNRACPIPQHATGAASRGPGWHPAPVCHEWNTIAHLNEYEGSPEARPFTCEELQAFLDCADEQVERAVTAKRKGALAAYRDATLFKVAGDDYRAVSRAVLGAITAEPSNGKS